ncbi:MAG: SDR family oxidoreductase [Acidimicrobiia bacterium]
MKILVTGGAGMLGSGLVPALAAAGHDVVVTDIDLSTPQPWGPAGPTIGRLDVRSWEEVRAVFERVRPDFVCHLAAETDLERSDADPSHAFATNTLGTKFVAFESERIDAPMVYISTAGVFDGVKDGPYHEWDDANPLNTYGKSKYEGERLVERFVSRHYIVRAGWMVGGGAGIDHKFVAKILGQVRDGRTTLHAVGDKLGTPTYVPDFAQCLLRLIATESYGRYHMVCEGEGSRFDVAAEILAVLGRADEIELVEVNSDFFAADYPSIRPRSEIMVNLHLQMQGLNTMRPWRSALREYLITEFPDLVRELSAPGVLDLTAAAGRRTLQEELA